MMQELGYSEEDVVIYNFREPGGMLESGLRSLGTDSDVLKLIKYAETTRTIEVYVQHIRTYPRNDVNTKEGKPDEVNEPQYVDLSDDTSDNDSDKESSGDEDSGSVEGSDNNSDDEDSDYLVDEDHIVPGYDVAMDEFRAAMDFDVSDAGEDNEQADEEGSNEEVDLDDFDTFEDNTTLEQAYNIIRKKKKKSKPTDDDPFFVGQQFTNRDEIKSLVKKHAIHSKRQLSIIRNESARFRVICLGQNINLGGCESNVDKTNQPTTSKGKSKTPKKQIPKPTCPWVLYISNVKKEGTWIVKTYLNKHTCLYTRDVKLCTISWLAKEIQPTIKSNPGIPIQALQDDLHRRLQVQVTRNQLFRAKSKALERIQGHYMAQYEKLRDYGEELLRSNPGSTVRIDVEPLCNPSSPTRQFRRMYVCLGALKQGFKLAGRPLLGLDGCFLKGPFPGQILTAMGVDANNGIYPVAYAVVEAETMSSWT
ncbi:putative transposase, MuDR, plant [Helianthus annuus]|nr:putative transposase, MuDR, plant [Helianthus annuus]